MSAFVFVGGGDGDVMVMGWDGMGWRGRSWRDGMEGEEGEEGGGGCAGWRWEMGDGGYESAYEG